MREKWLKLIEREFERVSENRYRPKGDFSAAIVTTGSYEKEKPDAILYYPEMAACARHDQAFRMHLETDDPDFLVVHFHRKPGYDASEYWHHVPWDYVVDIVIGRHG